MEITHLNCQSFSVRVGRERRESVGTEYGKKTISEFATIRVQTTGFKYCGYSAYVYTVENGWTRTDFLIFTASLISLHQLHLFQSTATPVMLSLISARPSILQDSCSRNIRRSDPCGNGSGIIKPALIRPFDGPPVRLQVIG